MAEVTLKGQKREKSTKGALNSLRRDGFVPGIVYAKGGEALSFTLDEIALNKVIFTTETHVINLEVEGSEPRLCIVKDIQFDPVTDKVIHVDLQGLTAGEKIVVEVPVNIVGTAIGVKKGGRLVQATHKLAVECLPKDIPQHLVINVEKLKINQAIYVRDLNYDNIELKNPQDAMVVGVTTARGVAADDDDDDDESADAAGAAEETSEAAE